MKIEQRLLALCSIVTISMLIVMTVASAQTTTARLRTLTEEHHAAYSIESIGTLKGYVASSAVGINKYGTVVGTICCATQNGMLYTQAVKYATGRLQALPGPAPLSSVPPDFNIAESAIAINDHNIIAGNVNVQQTFSVFCPQIGYPLGFLPNGKYVIPYSTSFACANLVANGINDLEQAVGTDTGYSPGGAGGSLPVLLKDRKEIVLGKSGGSANAINDAGTIVGHDNANIASIFAFRKTVEIGTLGGTQSSAQAINDRNVIVGSAATRGGIDHAFFYEFKRMYDLGLPSGVNPSTTSSTANGINHFNRIVGTYTLVGGKSAAFVFEHQRVYDLRSIARDAAGWTLDSASAINDCGEIVGTGTYRGRTVGFIARPTGTDLYSYEYDKACRR